MDISQMVQLISNIGFPIFVAVWLLWRSDQKEEQTQVILTELKAAIDKLCEKMNISLPGGGNQ